MSDEPLYVYRVENPIDFWDGWSPIADFMVAKLDTDEPSFGYLSDFFAFFGRACVVADQLGWDGDIRRSELYVSGLPEPNGGRVIIGWKQDNNGETFVASPVPLPWLRGDLLSWRNRRVLSVDPQSRPSAQYTCVGVPGVPDGTCVEEYEPNDRATHRCAAR